MLVQKSPKLISIDQFYRKSLREISGLRRKSRSRDENAFGSFAVGDECSVKFSDSGAPHRTVLRETLALEQIPPAYYWAVEFGFDVNSAVPAGPRRLCLESHLVRKAGNEPLKFQWIHQSEVSCRSSN